jgi:putative aldouronate transport system permease protein
MSQSALRHGSGYGRKTTGDRVFDIFNSVFWVVVVGIVIYPLWLVLIDSVSNPGDVYAGRVVIWPIGFSLEGYKAILASKQLLRSYLNSIIYTLSGTVFSVFLTMMGAYALSHPFPGKGAVNFFIIFTMFFSGGLIPSFIINRALGLYNNPLAMIVLGAVSVWNLMIARTYIQTNIPGELYDAAAIDGASHFKYFFRFVLPLSGVIMAVLSVYAGVARWNDYFTALVYIRDRNLLPLQTVLREALASLTSSAASLIEDSLKIDGIDVQAATRKAEEAKYCSIVVSTVPAVLLYVFMQKFFVKGVMIGSLKG